MGSGGVEAYKNIQYSIFNIQYSVLSVSHRTPRSSPTASSSYQRIYAVVRCVPKGQVATYGQVAALAGLPGHARLVGYAMHALPSHTKVPWHRVINAKGDMSHRSMPGFEEEQRYRLECEGISFDARGRIDLEETRWRR